MERGIAMIAVVLDALAVSLQLLLGRGEGATGS